jgi:hypothetical protein
MALTVEGSPTFTFGNRLRDLVEVHDLHGVQLPVTFGNQSPPVTPAPGTAAGDTAGPAFCRTGFRFDVPYGNAIGAMDDIAWVDGRLPLGIAVGYERHLQGALCPSYPEVQAWWMRQVENCIEAGVDGVDFRIVNHNRAFDWEAFGFNEPLVAAFKQRYGVDIRREAFDREAWRRLRGEMYTGFLRKASARLRQAGKSAQTHISARMGDPKWHTEMEIHYDWPAWIREGLMEEVTIKMGDMASAPAQRAAAMARAAGMKVNFCPYVNGVPKRPDGPEIVRHLVQEALSGGADGLIIYENAAFMAGRSGGAIDIVCPQIPDVMSERARR